MEVHQPSGAVWVRAPIPPPVAKIVGVDKPASLITSTISVTESAVSTMFNVIRATFKQTEKEAVTAKSVENHRSSSARRGRGQKSHISK